MYGLNFRPHWTKYNPSVICLAQSGWIEWIDKVLCVCTCAYLGLLQERSLNMTPPPQVREQSDHCDQADHWPLTALGPCSPNLMHWPRRHHWTTQTELKVWGIISKILLSGTEHWATLRLPTHLDTQSRLPQANIHISATPTHPNTPSQTQHSYKLPFLPQQHQVSI